MQDINRWKVHNPKIMRISSFLKDLRGSMQYLYRELNTHTEVTAECFKQFACHLISFPKQFD